MVKATSIVVGEQKGLYYVQVQRNYNGTCVEFKGADIEEKSVALILAHCLSEEFGVPFKNNIKKEPVSCL